MSNDRNRAGSYRPDIDGLRAIAVLSVLAFHAFPHRLLGGFVGVDCFFVISGFLIGGIILRGLETGDFRFGAFYARRVRRIFPALILVLTAVLAFGRLALLPDEYGLLGKHAFGGGAFIVNVMLYRESGYFAIARDLKPLLHLWSLSIEEQFYLVWPLALYAAHRLGARRWVVPGAMMLLSFLANLYVVGHDASAAFFLLPARLWELAAGTLLADLSMRTEGWPRLAGWTNTLAWTGMALVLSSFRFLSPATVYPGAWAAWPVTGTLLLVAAGPRAWLNRVVLSHRGLVAIGLISYPLYLWHWPLLSFARIVEADIPRLSTRLGLLAASFVLAAATYRFLELPLRHRPERRVWVSLVSSCLAVMAFGLAIQRWSYASASVQARADLVPKPWVPDVRGEAGCHNRFPFVPICSAQGAEEPEQILLIGDSHAAALRAGLALIRGHRGLIQFTQYNTIPLLDYAVVTTHERSSVPNRLEFVTKAVGYAIAAPGVKTVILSFYGPPVATGRGFDFGWQDLDWTKRVTYWKGRFEEPSARSLQEALRETLRVLTASGKRVVFVIDVPELGFNPARCEGGRPLSFLREPHSPCAIPRADYEVRAATYKDAVRSATRDFPQVQVFDPAPLLCDSEYCWAMRNGRFLYSDSNHLSDYGSEVIGRALGRILDDRVTAASPPPGSAAVR